jgi:hypothetical protein
MKEAMALRERELLLAPQGYLYDANRLDRPYAHVDPYSSGRPGTRATMPEASAPFYISNVRMNPQDQNQLLSNSQSQGPRSSSASAPGEASPVVDGRRFPVRDDFSYPRFTQPADGMALNSVRTLIQPSAAGRAYEQQTNTLYGSQPGHSSFSERFRGDSVAGNTLLSVPTSNEGLKDRVEYLNSMRSLRNNLSHWAGVVA